MRVYAIRGLICSLVLWALGCGEAEIAHKGAASAGPTVFPPQLHQWKDFEGKSVDLNDYKGKVVILNFWATWCVPCKKELPSMQKLYDAIKLDGVEVVAISIDRDKKDRIQQYIKNYNLTFPVLLDPNQKVRKDYFIMGLPTSYLIGADGKLKGFISGAREWNSTASKKMFSTLVQ